MAMNDFPEFVLKIVLSTGTFYLIYAIMLKRLTFFKINRFYLIISLLASIAASAINYQAPVTLGSNGVSGIIELKQVVVGEQALAKSFDWSFFIQAIMISVAAFFALKLIIQIATILRFYLTGEKFSFEERIVVSCPELKTSFSFFNWIFIDRNKLESTDFQKIFMHEQAHSRQVHSADILMFEIMGMLLWFNPFYWLLKRALKETHEFLADKAVIEHVADASSYRILLVQSTIGDRYFAMANNFNYSIIKKRLKMMTKQKSSRWQMLRFAMVLPVIAAILMVFSCGKTEVQVPQVAQKTTEKSGEVSLKNGSTDRVFEVVEDMPEYPGGETALRNFLATNIKYPEAARNLGIQGRVFVRFVVTSTGDVRDVTIARGVDPVLDKEATRVVQKMEKWKPGMQKGKPVSVYYTVPISFVLSK
jgi:TonB family protein